MRILLIYPNIVASPKDISTGLATISAVLKQGKHEIKLIDSTFGISDKEIIEKAKSFAPGLIAMTVASNDYSYAVHISKLLKPLSISMLAGGFHALIAPEDLIEYFDFVCIGEGEYSILELANKLEKKQNTDKIKNLWIRKDNKIIKNPLAPLIQNIDRIPFPDRSIFNYQKYINWNRGLATFISTRGCPYQCTYCINHYLMKKYPGQKYIRFRSVDNLIKEIKQVINNYNVKVIEFYDDTFTLDKERVIEFCKRYREIGLPFYINTQVNSIDREMLYNLKKAGCKRVSIGIESGNENIRNKLLKRNMTNEKIINVFRWCKQLKLETYAFNMIGMPYETKKQIKETIKLNRMIQPDYIGVSIFNAFKGTELYDFCKQNNLLKEKISKDYFRESNIKTNLTQKQLRRVRDSFGFRVYITKKPIRAVADLIDKKMLNFPYYTLFRSKLISIIRK